MGDTYRMNGRGSTYHGPTNRIPPYPNYENSRSGWDPYVHAASGQSLDLADISSLKAEISVLKYQLTEREKEIAEAQSAITYLFKLNAFAKSKGMFCDVDKARNGRDGGDTTRSIVEAIKDVSIAVITALSGSGHVDREGPASFHPHTSAVGEDLLDLSDTNLGSGTNLLEKKADSGRDECFLDGPEHFETREGQEGHDNLKQATLGSKEGFSFETMDFPPLPYVKRFSHPKKQETTSTSSSSLPSQDHFTHVECPETSQTSIDVSSLDLNGSTQYEASVSTGLTSLNSSFNSSDNGIDELGRCSGAEGLLKTSAIQQDSISYVRDWIPHGGRSAPISKPTFAIPTAFPDADQHPAQVSTVLFMPKWPIKPFGLLSQERERAIYIHKRVAGDQENNFPDLFKYGIRYRPEPTETNLYRTVVVDNLPANITLFVLLQHVKGGAVADAKLLDTTSINGGSTAMITFVHEHGAKAFENRAYHHTLEFDGIRARVTLLPTPSYPIPGNLQAAILRHKYTRCLQIENFPRGIKPAELGFDLRVCDVMSTHRIESKRMRPDGVLELRFTSIGNAGRAYGKLTTWRRYQQCIVRFAPDPCAQPWDEESDKPIHVIEQEKLQKRSSPGTHVSTVSNTAKAAASNGYEANHVSANLRTKAPSLSSPTSEDQTGRLSNVDFHSTSEIQRGRGFSSEESHPKERDSCKQQ
ncbi:MAG: hypothetical protein LQ343_006008 [Gyalolechia ehrenbergii]|nr:MAG: hypothetical protein LQ343_006008 [Gyalolechia ehrenbergii]